METKAEEEVDDNTRYTEVDFSWPIEIIRRGKNLIKEYKVRKRAIGIKKLSPKKDSKKRK
ncbi:MAG: hypothetical protein NTV03_00145 [Candidatus Nomurabacteria bacterium]|nr:hypothetical protein [Candidatus Nomurabacteria bacterium]